MRAREQAAVQADEVAVETEPPVDAQQVLGHAADHLVDQAGCSLVPAAGHVEYPRRQSGHLLLNGCGPALDPIPACHGPG